VRNAAAFSHSLGQQLSAAKVSFPVGYRPHFGSALRCHQTDSDQTMDRYDGKPFLRLLDCYVLDAIDQLTDEQRKALSLMEPKLNAAYNSLASWQELVRTQMDLPTSFPDSVRRLWAGYLGAAKDQGLSVLPGDFVEQFVHANFPEVDARR
jgi:hypothetical protein